MSFSHLIIANEINKFGYELNEEKININLFSVLNFVFLLLIIPFIFFYPSASYLFLIISFYFAFYLLFNSTSIRKYALLIFFCFVGFLFIFLFAF